MCVRVCCKELQLCVQELNVDGFKHFGMHEGDASKLISAKLQKHKNQGVLKCNYPFVCVCACVCVRVRACVRVRVRALGGLTHLWTNIG